MGSCVSPQRIYSCCSPLQQAARMTLCFSPRRGITVAKAAWTLSGVHQMDSMKKRQRIQMLSCVPVVIIPTDAVPISYGVFFVSPFHPNYEAVRGSVPTEAAEGFTWNEEEEEGVEVVYGARRAIVQP